jgi:t-SNARE complex subunit (syntaxin)
MMGWGLVGELKTSIKRSMVFGNVFVWVVIYVVYMYETIMYSLNTRI